MSIGKLIGARRRGGWHTERVYCPHCEDNKRSGVHEDGGIKCFSCSRYTPAPLGGVKQKDDAGVTRGSTDVGPSPFAIEKLNADRAMSLDYLKPCRECDDQDERAAIIEFEANLSREEAEMLAGYIEYDPTAPTENEIQFAIASLRIKSQFASLITQMTRPTILSEWQIGISTQPCRPGCHLCLAAGNDPAIVYWFLDRNGKVQNAKKMWFRDDGFHRFRDENHVTHIMYPGNPMPLYGEWQLVPAERRPFALFESEKSAIIASAALPQFVCLAVCGHELTNAERAKVLRGRKGIILFDREPGAIEGAQKAKSTLERIGARASVESLDEFFPGIPYNWDVADVVYNQFLEWERNEK